MCSAIWWPNCKFNEIKQTLIERIHIATKTGNKQTKTAQKLGFSFLAGPLHGFIRLCQCQQQPAACNFCSASSGPRLARSGIETQGIVVYLIMYGRRRMPLQQAARASRCRSRPVLAPMCHSMMLMKMMMEMMVLGRRCFVATAARLECCACCRRRRNARSMMLVME